MTFMLQVLQETLVLVGIFGAFALAFYLMLTHLFKAADEAAERWEE